MKKFAISNHAVQRFRSRLRLHFAKSVFEFGAERFTLAECFKKAHRSDFALQMKPGIYNQLCIKHGGPVSFYDYNNLIRFCCVDTGSALLLKTVFSLRN